MAHKLMVLCVDDRSDCLLVRKLMLEQFGCEVVGVDDARSCLERLAFANFDLALIDYHLGCGTNGEELARAIRASRPNLPVIMLTGDPDVPESVRTTVDALLFKGVSSPTELLDRIEELVPGANLRKPPGSVSPRNRRKAS
jgi:CheY-like chemotaxis protein